MSAMSMMGTMAMMRQMSMMCGGDDESDAAQGMSRQMQQQYMMGQMGAMQMMMGQMNNMSQEETGRQMGQQVRASSAASWARQGAAGLGDEGDVPPGPSSSVRHPNYRPLDSEPMPGITDRRFEGRISLWFEDKGYGFIECELPRKRFPDIDVFLHENQRRTFGKGDWVSFGVFLNFRGKPQATELRKKEEPT